MSPTTEQLPGLELLGREVERCGWRESTTEEFSEDLFFQTAQGGVRTPTRLYQSDPGDPLLIVEFEDLLLGSRDELFPRFLDFSMETRMALGAARLVSPSGYLLLRSAGQIDLYRLPNETLEYRVRSAREFEDELLPALAAKAKTRSEPLQAVPSPLQEAQALREWLTHWSEELASHLEVDSIDCQKFLWKLILMLQTSRKTLGSEMLGDWGLNREKLGETWTLSYDPLSTLADLTAQVVEFEQTFSTRIFTGDAEMHVEWLGQLEETSLGERLRAELLMQSSIKFEPETVAWLYTDVDREQEGWRHEVGGLAPIRKRVAADGWQVLDPLVCDIGKYGLTAALRDLDRLAQHWADHDAYIRAKRERGELDINFSQPDLFAGALRGIGPGGELDDGVNFLFSQSIRLANVRPEQEFGVGIAFLLKALSYPRRFDWPFFGIDTLDRLWQDAP